MNFPATQWRNAGPWLLSLLRVVSAYIFMLHGSKKLIGLPGGDHFHLIGLDKLWSLAPGLAGVLELGGGFLLLIGLCTRPVAFVLSGFMAFAYFMAHAPRSVWPVLNGGDAAILFCFVFLYLSAVGGGPLALDHWNSRRRHTRRN